MAEIDSSSGIDKIHGKFKKTDAGYFYIRNGKQFYRDRAETYQKNQSPRQKWNSEAFAYANQKVAELLATPQLEAQQNKAYNDAKQIASNGKSYTTLRAWLFNSALHDFKSQHPFSK